MGHIAWLSIGSNTEKGDLIIKDSFKSLKAYGPIVSSNIYRTPSTNDDGTWYFNCVTIIDSKYDYDILNKKLKEIELQFGRSSKSETNRRVELDLDIVIFDSNILRENDFIQDYFQIGFKELNHD